MDASSQCSDARAWRSAAAALVAACVLVLSSQTAMAQGAQTTEKVGPIYPIGEPDMIEEIENKLKGMEKSGRLKEKIDEAIARSTKSAQYPRPVQGLGKSRKARTYYFDPSIVATSDIKDTTGKLVVAAGTRVNPLDYVGMSEWLIFFDGTDPGQVLAAEALAKKYEWMVKPIMTNGGPIDLMRKWKKRVYFDQGGNMVKKLGIENVPALVTQDGKRLRIDEITY